MTEKKRSINETFFISANGAIVYLANVRGKRSGGEATLHSYQLLIFCMFYESVFHLPIVNGFRKGENAEGKLEIENLCRGNENRINSHAKIAKRMSLNDDDH